MDNIEHKIDIITRQTNYTREEASDKLKVFEFNELEVIKEYFGIKEKKPDNRVASLNQEIYKQIRYRLDGSMRDFNMRVEKGEARNML
jgi:hypothetical protein